MSAERTPASVQRRVLAVIVDGAVAWLFVVLLAVVPLSILFALNGNPRSLLWMLLWGQVVALAWLLVQTLMQAGAGSIGMRLVGLRLIREDDGEPLGFARALGRNVLWGLAVAVIVGYFSPLFDRSPWHRGWHDVAVGAVMIDARTAGDRAPTGAVGIVPAPMAPPVVVPPMRPTGTLASPAPPAPSAPSASPAPSLGTPVLPTPPAPPEPPSATTVASATTTTPAPLPTGDVISFVPGVSAPARPAPAPAAPTIAPGDVPVDETLLSSRPRAIATLVWDDGTRHTLYGRTVFGRNPTPETGTHTVPVRDETLSLSKTHFDVDADDAGVWVRDRHSTNGVTVRRGTELSAIAAGERVIVRAGDILEFGDRRVTVEVPR